MSPIENISGEKLYIIWQNIIKVVTTIGFDVSVTMTDQHQSNVKFFEKVLENSLNAAYKESHLNGLYKDNPFTHDNRIFFLFDIIHLYKNFYNNFLRHKLFECPFFPPADDHTQIIQANFSHIQELYDLEAGKPERMAFKLSKKMLNSSSIEKTNVQLANICFHESTINGLRYYANNGYPYFQGTAAFLQIIHDWFSIINVKSLYAGQKSREKFREPIYQQDRNFQLDYLENVIC